MIVIVAPLIEENVQKVAKQQNSPQPSLNRSGSISFASTHAPQRYFLNMSDEAAKVTRKVRCCGLSGWYCIPPQWTIGNVENQYR